MATAQVQQVVAAPVQDNDRVKEEEKNNEIIQDPPCGKVEEQESDANLPNNGDTKDQEVPADDKDEGQRIAREVEAKLTVQPAGAEAKETKGGRPHVVKKAEKASSKGVVVPVDNDTDDEVVAPSEGVKTPEKAADKCAVVPADDEKDDEVVAPVGHQAPAAVPVALASEKVVEAGGEEATKGGKKDACEEKDHEE